MDHESVRTWWPIITFVILAMSNAAFTIARVRALEKDNERRDKRDEDREDRAAAEREHDDRIHTEAFQRIGALEQFRAEAQAEVRMLMKRVFNGRRPHDDEWS